MKEFIENYIKAYRENMNNVDNDRYKTDIPSNIQEPTQFEILKVLLPERILFITLFYNIENLPDLKSQIFSVQYDLSNEDNWTNEIKKFIFYNNLISENGVDRPEIIVENLYPLVITEIFQSLNNFYDYIQMKIIGDSENRHLIWIYNGEVESLKVEQQVSSDFTSAFFTPEMIGSLFKTSVKKIEPKFKTQYSAYIKPPVWLGEFPKYTILDELKQTPLSKWLKWIFNEEIKTEEGKITIKIRSNGYIQLIDSSKKTCIDFMNLFVAFLALNEYDVFSIPEHELISQEIKAKGNISQNVISSHSFRGEDRGFESRIRNAYYPTWLLPKNFLSIKPEDVNFAFENAKNYLFHPKKYVIILYLNAFTYYRHSDYIQSFMNSWIIIENYLHQILQNYLKEKDIKSKRKRKFRYYSTDTILEILEILDIVSIDDFKVLMKLKRKRNKLIHRLKPITRKEAFQCLSISNNTIKEMIKEVKSDK